MTRKLWMECETHISIYQIFKKGAQLWNPWVGPHTCHAYLHSIGIMCSKFHKNDLKIVREVLKKTLHFNYGPLNHLLTPVYFL